MRPLLATITVACLTAGGAMGANDIRFIDGDLRFWNRPFEIWGAHVPDWQRVATDPQAVRDTFQVLADRGVNTIGVALQDRHRGSSFFAPDGQAVDAATAGQFAQLAAHVRDHGMACVIDLFSSDRACWLESEQAYRQAVQTAVRLLPIKHATVFVVGDLSGGGRWPSECPYPMHDRRRVIDLCRVMDKANPQVVVGIPARFVHPGAVGPKGNAPLLYLADSPEDLKRLIDRSASGQSGEPLPRGVVCVTADCFFLPAGRDNPEAKALDRYLESVESRRLAVKAPPPATAVSPAEEPLSAQEKAEGFVPLFNGRDLDGWTTLRADWSTWSVENGCIKCSGADGQWLRTRKRFGSFVLRFEFKIGSNGNSGVFVWSPLEARSSRFGMEMQILGVHKDKPDDDSTGAIYDVLPPMENPTFEIGGWNSTEIACEGSRVRVTLNGRTIQDFDADQVPKLKGRLRRGFIGLQDHASPVWFRRIRIRELDPLR